MAMGVIVEIVEPFKTGIPVFLFFDNYRYETICKIAIFF
jgi:hypothetical protein